MTACRGIYTVHQGENIFRPQYPAIPWASPELHYQFKLDSAWWVGPLTDPPGWGFKGLALGTYNYHFGGLNSAIGYDDGQLYWWPRYYEITNGTYRLHEMTECRISLRPGIWYDVRINTHPCSWNFNGNLVVLTNFTLPHSWMAWPFLGRSGHDNNYPGGPIPGVFAARDLKIEIRIFWN